MASLAYNEMRDALISASERHGRAMSAFMSAARDIGPSGDGPTYDQAKVLLQVAEDALVVAAMMLAASSLLTDADALTHGTDVQLREVGLAMAPRREQ